MNLFHQPWLMKLQYLIKFFFSLLLSLKSSAVVVFSENPQAEHGVGELEGISFATCCHLIQE